MQVLLMIKVSEVQIGFSIFHHLLYFNALLLYTQVTVIINQLMRRPGPDWLSVTSLLLLPALHHLLHLPHGNVPAGWWGLLANFFQIQVRVNLAFWVTEM